MARLIAFSAVHGPRVEPLGSTAHLVMLFLPTGLVPKWVVLKWDHAALGRTAHLAIYSVNIYVYHQRTNV